MKQILLVLMCVLLFPLALTGCVQRQALQIEPLKKSLPIAPKFQQNYYFFDRDQTLYFVMRADSKDSVTGKNITQIATIRVFWHPHGGVTTLNNSALNSTFRYIVMTDESVGMYEGAGFVRLYSKDGKSPFHARVMDADMRLTQASANFKDTLGRSRMRGSIFATYNDAAGTDLLLDAQREFFARSMNSKPAAASPDDMPATQPASDDYWGVPGSTTAPATQPTHP